MLHVSLRRVGGLWFWRIGRLGGSVYLARRKSAHREAMRDALPTTPASAFAGAPYHHRRTLLLCGIAR
jgi:hypothetical protein